MVFQIKIQHNEEKEKKRRKKKGRLPGYKLARFNETLLCWRVGWGGVGVAQCLALLDAAVIAMAVRIFETQAHLWTIFLQVDQLLAVECSSALPESKCRN